MLVTGLSRFQSEKIPWRKAGPETKTEAKAVDFPHKGIFRSNDIHSFKRSKSFLTQHFDFNLRIGQSLVIPGSGPVVSSDVVFIVNDLKADYSRMALTVFVEGRDNNGGCALRLINSQLRLEPDYGTDIQ